MCSTIFKDNNNHDYKLVDCLNVVYVFSLKVKRNRTL